MPVRKPFDARHKFIDTRVVLHSAGAERIHTQIDGVIPSRKASEMANDFDLADFRHITEILTLLLAKQLSRIYFRDIERWQFPSCLARRRLFKNQAFVLINVTRRFTSDFLHRATFSGSVSFILRIERSLSATRPTAVSIIDR